MTENEALRHRMARLEDMVTEMVRVHAKEVAVLTARVAYLETGVAPPPSVSASYIYGTFDTEPAAPSIISVEQDRQDEIAARDQKRTHELKTARYLHAPPPPMASTNMARPIQTTGSAKSQLGGSGAQPMSAKFRLKVERV